MSEDVKISSRILGNKHLAQSLRVRLHARFSGSPTAQRILGELSDTQIVQRYIEHEKYDRRVVKPAPAAQAERINWS